MDASICSTHFHKRRRCPTLYTKPGLPSSTTASVTCLAWARTMDSPLVEMLLLPLRLCDWILGWMVSAGRRPRFALAACRTCLRGVHATKYPDDESIPFALPGHNRRIWPDWFHWLRCLKNCSWLLALGGTCTYLWIGYLSVTKYCDCCSITYDALSISIVTV